MDTKASLHVTDLITHEVFAAQWMQSQSQYAQGSATRRWAMIWTGVDFHVVGLMVPDTSFLGVVLSYQRDQTLWRSEMFHKVGYPVSLLFCTVGSDAVDYKVGCIVRVLEEEQLQKEGLTEYDAAFCTETPLDISEIIEDWREEYSIWKEGKSKNVWDQRKMPEDGGSSNSQDLILPQ